TRAAITPACVAMDPLDVVNEVTICSGSPALRARAPGIIAGRRDPEHVAHDRHGVVGAAIFDEAESHVGTPAKIAIDFLKKQLRHPPEWPATRSPAIWPSAEGWRGRGGDIVAHIGRHPDPCSSCRAGACCRIKPQSCGRSPSRPSTYPHVRTADDRMLPAPYRFDRPLWPPTATAQLPDWRIVAYAKTAPCRRRSCCPGRGRPRKGSAWCR